VKSSDREVGEPKEAREEVHGRYRTFLEKSRTSRPCFQLKKTAILSLRRVMNLIRLRLVDELGLFSFPILKFSLARRDDILASDALYEFEYQGMSEAPSERTIEEVAEWNDCLWPDCEEGAEWKETLRLDWGGLECRIQVSSKRISEGPSGAKHTLTTMSDEDPSTCGSKDCTEKRVWASV